VTKRNAVDGEMTAEPSAALDLYATGVEGDPGLATDQCVAGVLATGIGGDDEPGILGRRDILGAVDGEVDLARQQRRLERPDEGALAPRGVGRALIPDGSNGLDLDRHAEGSQRIRHEPGLGHRKRARAGSEP